jgi:RNA polymerase sigma factor (sigma-70 family)
MGERDLEARAREERWCGWMAAAQRGDAACYQKLLVELLPFVRSLVRARLRDAADDDVMQDVLLSIHMARHTFRTERRLTPWVRAIARNAVIDHARRRARSRETELETPDAVAASQVPTPEGLSPRMQRALDRLPDLQRQAVLLLKVEGLSVEEAATRLGVSRGAVKLRAHRGYRALRDLLGRESV